VSNTDSNWPELRSSLQKGSANELDVEGKKITLNNIERTLWSEWDITKADLIRYYLDHSDLILPYVRNRPLSLHIKHNGVGAPGMYIKGMEGNQPEWAETFLIPRRHLREGRSKMIDYLLCQDQATLVFVLNLGCIDLNPWNSTKEHPLNPDYLVIDLDPSDEDFDKVREVAKAAKSVLSALKLHGLPKTSGKTGIHIFLPVDGSFTYSQARTIVSRLTELIHAEVPEISTLHDSISARGDKVFLDDNQNDLADTLASAYSVRPFHVPSVSTPLKWSEINKKFSPGDFNITTMPARIRKVGDLFGSLFKGKLSGANVATLQRFL
jgi:bifunctional non-homologous end joining protein LigD